MAYRVNVREFLWYREGDIVSDSDIEANPHWVTEGHVIKVENEPTPEEPSTERETRIFRGRGRPRRRT